MTVTDILNALNEMAFFSYVIPFLLIFAVSYALIKKTKLLGEDKAIHAIVAIALGFLALQFDAVSKFYANIFPKFGIGLAVLLVVLILLEFVGISSDGKSVKWMGWVVGIGVAIWAIINWNTWWSSGLGFTWWIGEYFWAIVVLAIVVGAVFSVIKFSK